MKFIINGMGCGYGGGRLILENYCNNKPKNINIIVIAPLIKKYGKFNLRDARVFYLRHKLWGRYLRPILDFSINLYSFMTGAYILNLSNYGFSHIGNNILYFQNLYLIDYQKDNLGLSVWLVNWINRFAFNLSLKKSLLIIVQSDHTKQKLLEYCRVHNICPVSIKVLKPYHKIEYSIKKSGKKNFQFQLFYPTSGFSHKNNLLSIKSVILAHQKNKNVGLVITTDDFNKCQYESVNCIGKVTHSKVTEIFNISDALLFTSSKETVGLPLLEALNVGKPAILPDEEYAREIYGSSALYFKEYNENEISELILLLIDNYNYYKQATEKRKEIEEKERYTWNEQWNKIIQFTNKKKSTTTSK